MPVANKNSSRISHFYETVALNFNSIFRVFTVSQMIMETATSSPDDDKGARLAGMQGSAATIKHPTDDSGKRLLRTSSSSVTRMPSSESNFVVPVTPDRKRLSDSESTGFVLTKALNALASSDYDVVTPPRQTPVMTPEANNKKKPSLFRPYDLDNGKTSDKKGVFVPAVTCSPMLLRANYGSSSGQWHIERRNKSESIYNQDTGIHMNTQEHVTVSVAKQMQTNTVKNSLSNSVSQQSEISLKIETDSSSFQQYEREAARKTIPVSKPLSSSTPKKVPCPSPNVPVTVIEHHGSMVSPVISEPSEVIEKKCIVPHLNPMVKYGNQTPTGHRLPLKHSYKNQVKSESETQMVAPICTPVPSSFQINNAAVRQRSSSCPPTPDSNSLHKTLQETQQTSRAKPSTLSQKHIVASIPRTHVEAVKETWARHHAIMSSRMPQGTKDNQASLLPSFSTFSRPAGVSRSLDDATSLLHSSRDTASAGEKHARSRSDGMLQTFGDFPMKPVKRNDNPPRACTNYGRDSMAFQHETQQSRPLLGNWHKTVDVNKESYTHTTTHQVPSSQSTSHHTVSSQSTMFKPPNHGLSSKPEPKSADRCERYGPEILKPSPSFNPATDVYRDQEAYRLPYMAGYMSAGYPSPRYDPRLYQAYGYHSAYFNPLTAHALQMEMANVHKPQTPPVDYRTSANDKVPTSQDAHKATTIMRPTQLPMDGGKQVEQLRSSLVDPRRPLGTSALQNKSPLASPALPGDKMPLNTLLYMMKVII